MALLEKLVKEKLAEMLIEFVKKHKKLNAVIAPKSEIKKWERKLLSKKLSTLGYNEDDVNELSLWIEDKFDWRLSLIQDIKTNITLHKIVDILYLSLVGDMLNETFDKYINDKIKKVSEINW